MNCDGLWTDTQKGRERERERERESKGEREGGREGGTRGERQFQGSWYVSSARCTSLVAFLFARVCLCVFSRRP